MFTADMARAAMVGDFDEALKALVSEARPNTNAYYKVWYSSSMEKCARDVADKLRQRGFKCVHIRDLSSFRFAEVHFSWGED